MAGDAADLVFTDPPYNVDYEGYTEERLKIKGDRMSDAEFKQFLEAAFRSCRTVVKPGASLYVCHSSSWQREFQNALEIGRLRGSLPDHLGQEHFRVGFRPLQVPARTDVLCHVAAKRIPGMATKPNRRFGKKTSPRRTGSTQPRSRWNWSSARCSIAARPVTSSRICSAAPALR